eukprot:COSAG01_NODE_2792_length_7061_cov_20.067222_9_plen_250_part_00
MPSRAPHPLVLSTAAVHAATAIFQHDTAKSQQKRRHHPLGGWVDECLATGGSELALATMRAHSGEALVQQFGIALLYTLVLRSEKGGGAGVEAAQRVLGGSGGGGTAHVATAVAGAMRAHPGSAPIQTSGAQLLRRLAQLQLRGGGAVETVHALRSLQAPSSSASSTPDHVRELAAAGCLRLWGLITGDCVAKQRHKIEIAAAGGVEVLVGAMRAHAAAAPLQYAACGASRLPPRAPPPRRCRLLPHRG